MPKKAHCAGNVPRRRHEQERLIALEGQTPFERLMAKNSSWCVSGS